MSAAVFGLALVVVVLGVNAGARSWTPAAEPAPATTSPTLEEIGERFRRGQDKFDTSDFAGAIEQWTRAYEDLPEDPQYAATRAMLLANIAQAHVEAYAIDGTIDHLRHADVLFSQYRATVDPADEETLAAIDARKKEIAGAIAEHEAREQAERDAEAAATPVPPRIVREPPRRDREPTPYTKSERAMLIGGGVTLAFGVGTIGATGSFLWLRDEEEKEGRERARMASTSGAALHDHFERAKRLNRFAISSGAAAAVLTAIGVGVIVAAQVHRSRRRRAEKAQAWIVPIGVAGRF